MSFMSEVYYRVIKAKSGRINVVCLQDFDEIDYDQRQFLTKEKFDMEEEAQDFINSVILMAAKMEMK